LGVFGVCCSDSTVSVKLTARTTSSTIAVFRNCKYLSGIHNLNCF
jgi:hypothetical protein